MSATFSCAGSMTAAAARDSFPLPPTRQHFDEPCVPLSTRVVL